MISVLVVDAEAPLRGALSALVAGEPDMVVAGEAGTADEAIELAAELAPDVAVVAMRIPGGGALAARGIRDRAPDTRVLALSAYEEKGAVLEMLSGGASGYLIKGTPAPEILDAVRRAVRGQASLAVPVMREVIDELGEGAERRRETEAELRRSEARFRSLMETSPDAVVIADDHGLIASMNGQAERMFGFSRQELIGKPVETLVPPRFRPTDQTPGVALPHTWGQETGTVLFGLRKDGSEFPADISLSGVGSASGVVTSRVRDITADTRREETQGKRDAQFAAAFIRDMTERQARADLERELAERRALLGHLVAADEDQRRRIANDIHDDSIQIIAAAGMRLHGLRRELEDPKQLMLLDELEQTIRLSVSRLRHLLFELRPPVLDSEGLSAALALYIDKIAQESEGRYTRQDELVVQPDEQTRVILYRIAQEAITNVRKHAGPANVTVLLRERDGGYLVQIADDGVGFASGDQTSLQGHLGLAAMRERATLAGGWVRVESAPGEGTTVQAWVPSRQTDEDSSANSTTG